MSGKRKSQPMYMQLYNRLVDDILSGNLPPGAKLESRRKLAEHLDMSVSTVNRAYWMLVDNGFVMSYPKRGFFVCSADDYSVSNSSETHWEDNSYIYNLSYNGVNTSKISLRNYAAAARSAMYTQSSSTDFFDHVSKRGNGSFRQSLLRWLYRDRGIKCDVDHTVIGCGILYLLQSVLPLFKSEDVFAIQTPNDPHIYNLLRDTGNRLVLLRYNFTIKELEESGANVFFAYPEHHLPSGVFMDADMRSSLCRWLAEDESRYIIENAYDYQLNYSGVKLAPLYNMDKTGRVMYIDSFEHDYSPAIKICYCLMPDSLLVKMSRGYYVSCASQLEQLTLAELLDNSMLQKHFSKMRNYYKSMRDLIRHCIEISPLNGKVEILNDYAGTFFLLKVNLDMSSDELQRRAIELGVKLLTMNRVLDDEQSDERTIIFGFGDLSSADITKIIHLLAMAWI